MPEKHQAWRSETIPGSLFDFTLYFLPQLSGTVGKGQRSLFLYYKTQSWRRSRPGGRKSSAMQKIALICRAAQIKATLLIETLPAVFQMDEILHALRDHIVGLNCGVDGITSLELYQNIEKLSRSRPARQTGSDDG
ncbi:hypothetical protein ACLK2D_21150 [Escherichia coli]